MPRAAKTTISTKSSKGAYGWYNAYNYLSGSDSTYENALLIELLGGRNPQMVLEDALVLNAFMSSMTPALRKLTYNYGASVGRSLYDIMAKKGKYFWQGDSILDLIAFIEKSGYKRVYYKISQNSIEIRIVRSNKADLGANIHNFEAGIISGFLSSGSGTPVNVSERTCCNNSGEYCSFVSSIGREEKEGTPEISKLIAYAARPAESNISTIPTEYRMMSITPLLNPEYYDSLMVIMSHLGTMVANERLGININNPKAGYMVEMVTNIGEKFGMGSLKGTARPMKLEVIFQGARAKKEFVDISIGFLTGMLKPVIGSKQLGITYSKSGESYKVSITRK